MFIVLGLTLSACGGSGTNQQPDPTEPPPAPQGVIQGTILSASGDPVADAQVVLTQIHVGVSAVSTQAVGMGTTDSAGQFGVDVPSAGTYSVVMVQNDLGVHTTVDVVEQGGGLTASELDLTATAVGAVSGHVVYPDGSDASDVLVFLRGTSFLALADATGDFIISGVPASSYVLVAKEDDFASPGVTVSVTSGGATSLTADVELVSSVTGPVVTSVSPSGIQAVEDSGAMVGTPITITGSGFGDSKNNSLLLYEGIAVPNTNIVSWSDAQIVVEWNVAESRAYLESTEARYEVATSNGSDASEPVLFYQWNAYSHMLSSTNVELRGSAQAGAYPSARRVAGVTFGLAVDRGTLSATSAVTVISADYGPVWTVELTPADLLPHFATVVSGGMAKTVVAVCCEGSGLQAREYVPDVESTIQGIVRANDYATPVPNATGLSFVVVTVDSNTGSELGETFRTPITTDANGEFSVLVTLPALPSEQYYQAHLEYQTERVGWLDALYPAP